MFRNTCTAFTQCQQHCRCSSSTVSLASVTATCRHTSRRQTSSWRHPPEANPTFAAAISTVSGPPLMASTPIQPTQSPAWILDSHRHKTTSKIRSKPASDVEELLRENENQNFNEIVGEKSSTPNTKKHHGSTSRTRMKLKEDLTDGRPRHKKESHSPPGKSQNKFTLTNPSTIPYQEETVTPRQKTSHTTSHKTKEHEDTGTKHKTKQSRRPKAPTSPEPGTYQNDVSTDLARQFDFYHTAGSFSRSSTDSVGSVIVAPGKRNDIPLTIEYPPFDTDATPVSTMDYYLIDDSESVPFPLENVSPTFRITTENGVESIRGTILDVALDLKNIVIGATIHAQEERTLSDAICEMWQSIFFTTDRIHTSRPFCKAIGLRDEVLPFNLMLFLTTSMTHEDHAKLHVGLNQAIYHLPAYAGDTFRKKFIVKSLRNTSDGKYAVLKVACELRNQDEDLVFSADKILFFPREFLPKKNMLNIELTEREIVDLQQNASINAGYSEDGELEINDDNKSSPCLLKSVVVENPFLHILTSNADAIDAYGTKTTSSIPPDTLIIHTLGRPLSASTMMNLATLGRQTHAAHFNTSLYREADLLVPGALVLSLTTAAAARDLYETLFEELLECILPYPLHPDSSVGAISYVAARQEHVSGSIEALTIRTIGLKDVDVQGLAGRPIPVQLLVAPIDTLRPSGLEQILYGSGLHELSGKVVCIVDRKIYRPIPIAPTFLL